MNPFEIFNIPVEFEINWESLNQRYLALQKAWHPDQFANKSNFEKRIAMQQSAQINDALNILKNDISRAESIIELNTGKKIDIETQTSFDHEFLMQQMLWREELDEISNDPIKIQDFLQKITTEKQNILEQLKQNLSQKNWEQALETTDKLRYLNKLLQQI